MTWNKVKTVTHDSFARYTQPYSFSDHVLFSVKSSVNLEVKSCIFSNTVFSLSHFCYSNPYIGYNLSAYTYSVNINCLTGIWELQSNASSEQLSFKYRDTTRQWFVVSL